MGVSLGSILWLGTNTLAYLHGALWEEKGFFKNNIDT